MIEHADYHPISMAKAISLGIPLGQLVSSREADLKSAKKVAT